MLFIIDCVCSPRSPDHHRQWTKSASNTLRKEGRALNGLKSFELKNRPLTLLSMRRSYWQGSAEGSGQSRLCGRWTEVLPCIRGEYIASLMFTIDTWLQRNVWNPNWMLTHHLKILTFNYFWIILSLIRTICWIRIWITIRTRHMLNGMLNIQNVRPLDELI